MKRRELVVRAGRLQGDKDLQAKTYLPGPSGQFSEWPETVRSRSQKFLHEEFPGWPDIID